MLLPKRSASGERHTPESQATGNAVVSAISRRIFVAKW